MPTDGVNSLCSKLKTPMEVLEDLAKEYEEHEQLKYEIAPTDTGYFDVPVEYLCEVSVGAIKGKYIFLLENAARNAANCIFIYERRDGISM